MPLKQPRSTFSTLQASHYPFSLIRGLFYSFGATFTLVNNDAECIQQHMSTPDPANRQKRRTLASSCLFKCEYVRYQNSYRMCKISS